MQIKQYAFAAALMALTTVSASAGTLSVQTLTPTVTAGQYLTLSVQITGATDLYGYQFDVGFNPAVLTATSVSEGGFLSAGGSTTFFPGTIDNTGGSIANNADLLDGVISGVNGSGDLLDLTFQALNAGSSTVSIFNVIALNSFGQGLSEATVNATVSVSPATASAVPEPGTWLLLGTGMLGLLTFLKRDHKLRTVS